MAEFPKISAFGDRGILIDFGKKIDSETLDKVLFYKNKIENELVKQELEIINTYNSLLVIYVSTIEDIYGEVLRFKELLIEANIPKNSNYKIFHIPVCYDKEFGLDLKYISEEKELSENEITELHTAPFYQVYFIGFLPGFLYLGGLDKKLQISRKETPRREVKKGSVGIGENQTGIYPKNSPGGWQILGKSPIKFFDKNQMPPSLFSAGDKIKFYSVSKDEFSSIEEEIEEGNFTLKIEVHES
tara:strand:- start:340 stop:1071 length:732 start_codon:yes stop_codon:yes gene_type:complete